MTKRLFLLIMALALTAAGLLTYVPWPEKAPHILVTITNVGAEPLHETVVHVRGASYSIGDIAPGATKSVGVRPEGESDVKLKFAGGRELAIDCYMDSGYAGTIAVDVTSTAILRTRLDIQFGTVY